MATKTATPYSDLPHLLHRLTGDEKHDASAHSTLDVLWVLYDRVLDVTPDRVDDPDRDRFLLSKGHGPAAYYAVLAAKGFIPHAWLDDLAGPDSRLGHHPDRLLVPGVEIGSGSLGHGLGLGVGTALGLRAQGLLRPRVYVLLGDAELDEGSNHEAIAYAGATGLDTLTAIVIDNQLVHARLAGRGREPVHRQRMDRDHCGRTRPRRHRGRATARTTRAAPHVVVARVEDEGVTAMRETFIDTATALLDDDPRTALVLADISAAASRRPPAATPTGCSTSASASS